MQFEVTEPGIYRAEVYTYRRRIGGICVGAQPWIFSNPLHILSAPGPAVSSVQPVADRGALQSRS